MNADQLQRIERIIRGAKHNASSAEDAEWLVAGWKAAEADAERLRAEVQESSAEVLRLSVLATRYSDERNELEAERASLCDAINTEARECHSPEAERPEMEQMKQAVRGIVDRLRSTLSARNTEIEIARSAILEGQAERDALRARIAELERDTATVREERTLELRLSHAREAEARRKADALEKALRDIEQWTQVAFYPGPNENPHFQAGFQEAVGMAAGIVARLCAALPSPAPRVAPASGEERQRGKP